MHHITSDLRSVESHSHPSRLCLQDVVLRSDSERNHMPCLQRRLRRGLSRYYFGGWRQGRRSLETPVDRALRLKACSVLVVIDPPLLILRAHGLRTSVHGVLLAQLF
jgi:hypothetical protein